MSNRNTARKSTSSPAKPSTRTSSRIQPVTRRSLAANSATISNSPIQSSDSEEEVPTQLLRSHRSSSSIPGTPGTSAGLSLRLTDDEEEDIPRRRNQREQSSSETTSDSDAAENELVERSRNTTNNKSKAAKKSPVKTRKRRQKRRESTDDEDYVDRPNQASTSKRNSSVGTPNRTQFQARNLSSMVNKCVYFLLIADQKKYAIKRQDILRHVFSNQDTKMFSIVMEEANKVLMQVYGIEITVLEKRRGEYLLINHLDRNLSVQEFMELSTSDLQKRGFIFYLLTVIYMNGNSISETDLVGALKPLGIDMTSRNLHPIFGDVRKYLTSELVKQMYLEYECISKDPPQYEFSWGIRAKQEVDKNDLLEFTCKILSDTRPEDWILPHKDAVDSAKQREENNRKKATR